MFVGNQLTAHSFLKLFDGESKITNGGLNKGEMYNALTLKDALKNNKQKNLDVYFYVNDKSRVKDFRACFIDLDAGRNDNGGYLTLKQVEDKKKTMWQEIGKLKLPPNLIVDTRNGYHLYWLIKDKCKLAEWKRTQNRICNSFLHVGADPLAIRPTQLLRVPGTVWYKTYEKQQPYDITWMSTNNPKYTIDEIDKAFALNKAYPTWVFVNTANMSKSGKNRVPEKYIYLKNSQAKKLLSILGLVVDMKLPMEKEAVDLMQIISGKEIKEKVEKKKEVKEKSPKSHAKKNVDDDEEDEFDWLNTLTPISEKSKKVLDKEELELELV